MALSGNGSGFCGGYDLVVSAEQGLEGEFSSADAEHTVLGNTVQGNNHNPAQTWDPMIDYQMMSRNVKGFMSLFHCDKPVVCKVQGFCVAGDTDMALCSDLLVIEDNAKIGYPPSRVWGSPENSGTGAETRHQQNFMDNFVSGTVYLTRWVEAAVSSPGYQTGLPGRFPQVGIEDYWT